MSVVTDLLSWNSLLLLGVTCLLLWLANWLSSVCRGNLPPGPFPLPVLGNVHQIVLNGVNDLQQTFTAWGKQYGEIYTMYVGQERNVVLTSYDVIKEAFSQSVFSGRPRNSLTNLYGQHGIALVDGEFWKEQRRFTLTHMKDFGFGKMSMEGRILTEIKCLLDHLERECCDSPFDIQCILTTSVANIITSITWSKRYEYDDKPFQAFLQKINDSFKEVNNISAIDAVFPFLKHLPFDVYGIKRVKALMDEQIEFLREIVDDHKASLDPNSARDFVDSYLIQMEKEKENAATTFTDLQLLSVIDDLFEAGLETTSTTLRWTFLYLILHPEIQEKARAQIDDVIGDEAPSVHHRPRLPYIEAVLTEAHRLGMVLWMGVPHCTMADVSFRGYTIRKGTTIATNMASVFLDEQTFPNPTKFDPTRYLDEEGNLVKALCDKVIPFSIGRRVCIGESLARMELTLYLTSMLQRFTFSVPEGAPPPSTVGIQGFTHLPQSYKMSIKLRKS